MKNKRNILLPIVLGIVLMIMSCNSPITELKYDNPDLKIIFLHHSTGKNVWYGDVKQGVNIGLKKSMCKVPRLIKDYNKLKGKKISIEERSFPSGDPYPWRNYPYDYYNIWVKNAGNELFMEEPTLEMLTMKYNIIIFKHCFPGSNILEDDGNPDINSDKKTLANYKLQYEAIKTKLYEFPDNKFIVWTGAALIEAQTNGENARRAAEFSKWVKDQWDTPDDNIEIFDFREIETDGGLYLKPEYSYSKDDSHPNITLSSKAAELFVKKIIEVIEK